MKVWDCTLCIIADVDAARGRFLPRLVEEAVSAGATMVQMRAKKLDTADFFELAVQVSGVLKSRSIPLIINDRVDIALACGADGVHLGQKDLPLPHARSLLGKKKIIGISANTIEEALAAESQGADYLGVGPVFFTSSKQDLLKILGTEGLSAIKSAVGLPVLAIGGIDAARAGDVAAAGADGMAVISAILGTEDVSGATKILLNSFKNKNTLRIRD